MNRVLPCAAPQTHPVQERKKRQKKRWQAWTNPSPFLYILKGGKSIIYLSGCKGGAVDE